MCGGRGLALRGDGERIGEGGRQNAAKTRFRNIFRKGWGRERGMGRGGAKRRFRNIFRNPFRVA